MRIELYDKDSIEDGVFPDSEDGRYAKAYLLPWLHQGTAHFVSNASTKLYILRVDQHILPVTVNEEEYENSYVVSPYGALAYAQEEIQRLPRKWMRWVLQPITALIGSIFRGASINRVVMVNNWLLSTNLYPSLSQEQIEKVTAFLQEQFPTHAVAWRSINTSLPKGLLEKFRKLPCRLLFSRQCYLFDSNGIDQLASKQRWNIKADRALIEKRGYEVVRAGEIEESAVDRLKELYDLLYLEKYTHCNPQFTTAFLLQALRDNTMTLVALRKNGRYDGFVGYFARNGVMTTPLLGYDTKLPQEEGLYRMLTSICIDEACKHQLQLHHSSGAAHFKRVRGMLPDSEYSALFDQHLPLYRRFIWRVLAGLFNGLAEPIVTRLKL